LRLIGKHLELATEGDSAFDGVTRELFGFPVRAVGKTVGVGATANNNDSVFDGPILSTGITKVFREARTCEHRYWPRTQPPKALHANLSSSAEQRPVDGSYLLGSASGPQNGRAPSRFRLRPEAVSG